MRLRPYKPCDAAKLIEWSSDKKTFELWGGHIIGDYPITEDILNDVYFNHHGRCAEPDNFYPMTAFDETGMLGHFIMRYINGDNKLLRFGWVIVDASKRGQHIGRNMLKLGLKYAFEILGVDKVTIGVFENNVRFHSPSVIPDSYQEVDGEQWKVVELEISRDDYENDR